jgi:hypothetical protein
MWNFIEEAERVEDTTFLVVCNKPFWLLSVPNKYQSIQTGYCSFFNDVRRVVEMHKLGSDTVPQIHVIDSFFLCRNGIALTVQSVPTHM